MKILAVDTSSKTAYVSIVEAIDEKNIKPLLSYSYEAPSHTTALTKMIDSALNLSGIKFDDIALYAAAVGPGSFTGVRIGVSVIKGFAFVDSKPCIGVSSLDALAYGAKGHSGIITPLIDARRGTFYTAAYSSNGAELAKLNSESQLEYDDYFNMLGELEGNRFVLTGDGAEKVAEKAVSLGIKTDIAVANAAYGVAVAAYLKTREADLTQFTDSTLVPIYLKKSQAEREREERLAAMNNN